MITLSENGCFVVYSNYLVPVEDTHDMDQVNADLEKHGQPTLNKEMLDQKKAAKGTITYRILSGHNHSNNDAHLNIRFDSSFPMTSPMSESSRLPAPAA